MAKKNYIRIESEAEGYVVGIASNERIWKITWEINQKLELNLASAPNDLSSLRAEEHYVDRESDSAFDIFLIENTGSEKKIPKIAKEFRFWLIYKPNQEKVPDIAKIVSGLKEIGAITFCTDLSAQKDINKIIP